MARHITAGFALPPQPDKQRMGWRTYCLADDWSLWWFEDPTNFRRISTNALSDTIIAIWPMANPLPPEIDILYVGCADGTLWKTEGVTPANWIKLGTIPQT